MFNGLFMEKGHMVSEECGPYRGTTNGEKCKFYEKCSPVAKIEKSYFVGDMSNEAEFIDQTVIQKEILRNGAVVAEFAAPNRFKYYSEGILS